MVEFVIGRTCRYFTCMAMLARIAASTSAPDKPCFNQLAILCEVMRTDASPAPKSRDCGQPALYRRATCCGWQAARKWNVCNSISHFAGLAVMPSRGEFKWALLAKQRNPVLTTQAVWHRSQAYPGTGRKGPGRLSRAAHPR